MNYIEATKKFPACNTKNFAGPNASNAGLMIPADEVAGGGGPESDQDVLSATLSGIPKWSYPSMVTILCLYIREERKKMPLGAVVWGQRTKN